MDTRNKIFTVVGAVAIIAAAGVGGYTLFATKDNSSTPQTSQSTTATTSTPSAASTSSGSSVAANYKDGTYTASMSYNVPHGGQNTVNATVTISSGKITAVNATGDYTDGESSPYIDSFNSTVASDANGQALATYSPSRIGGASLTTPAFDSVLDTIRSKASA